MDLFHLSLKKCLFESKTSHNWEKRHRGKDKAFWQYRYMLLPIWTGSCPTGREDEEGCPQSGILSPAVFGAYLSVACPTHLYCWGAAALPYR